MVRIRAGIIALANEIDLEFGLAARHGGIADRALRPDAATSPHAIGTAIRERSGSPAFTARGGRPRRVALVSGERVIPHQ
jgi:hypothetical protein